MNKTVKRIVAVMCVMALFFGCAEFWEYILVDDTKSYTRIAMHQLYNPGQNIDVLFVGSSHVYRSLVPELTDEGFGCYTFNAGSSSQMMDGSLAIIKEANSCNDLKHIYLELYYGIAAGGDYKSRKEMTETYIISDYMKPSLRKVKYLLDASSADYWVNSFILGRRNWTKFFNSEYVRSLIAKKQQDAYKNYEWVKGDDAVEYYIDRGFVANDTTVPDDAYWTASANKIGVGTSISEDSDWNTSLAQIVEFCKKNKIELTFFVAPEPERTLVGTGNYQEYHKFISEIADGYGIELYDFNLTTPQYFDSNNRSYFKDEDHLNTNGAKAFSTLFSDFFMGRIAESELFYESYDEKIKDADIGFYGVAGPSPDKEAEVKRCRIITGNPDKYEFRVTAVPSEGEPRVLQEYSHNLQFELPIDETGILTITCRDINDLNNIQAVELEYQ